MDEAAEEGHKLYEKARSLEAVSTTRKLNNQEIDELVSLYLTMERLYNKA